MKKHFIFFASAALVIAASCNKAEIDTPVEGAPVEMELISVQLNPETKTSLSGMETVWSEGDAVSVTVGGENIGTLTLVEGNTFRGEIVAGHDGDAVLNYPAGVTSVPAEQEAVAGTFANGAALLEGTTTVAALRAGEGASLSNKTALLSFSVAVAGDVVFTLGEATYTVKGCKAGETYYACVAPVAGAALSYTVAGADGLKSKAEVTFEAGLVYELGELSVLDASVYGLVGSFQGWDVAKPIAMENSSNGWIVAKSVELYKNDEFKFVKDKSWDVSYGTSSITVIEEGQEFAVQTDNSQNMKVSKNGKFNLYLNPTALKVKVECVEEYTDLTVNITINNKANWSPLYIYLEADGVAITPAEGAPVSDNVYAVSGDYIGSTLTCKFISGSKASDVMNVAITKNGATVTLEETIIKLKIQLNTDNAKQWWGNTMKIHVWSTGTSFDTSWPGNTMTSEGNYTWSIIVPSELVGKTINYLVHNGNGWQSKDATVKIGAEGNTVTGSSIGIN
jgi:hypothetical protein